MSNQRSVVQQINEQQDFLLECVNSLLEWYMLHLLRQKKEERSAGVIPQTLDILGFLKVYYASTSTTSTF